MRGRRVVLGVSGGIAAYKAILLTRRLLEMGVLVDVVLTRGARDFVGAATFEGITGRRVRSEVWEDVPDGTHVELGRRADAVIVYPATAHTLAKFAHGLADDLLTTTVLAHRGPVLVAPAMHTEMWTHPATVANVRMLTERGLTIVGPAQGALMGGDAGIGRVVEPGELVAALVGALEGGSTHEASSAGPLLGRTVLVTAGGTREALDPVRYLGNRSSGRMGFALAEAAVDRGAHVVLITGPVALATPDGVERIDVTTALEMDAAVRAREGRADIVLMSAAVADFRSSSPLSTKWRRTDGPPTLVLTANPDILAGVVERRAGSARPIIVGFAAQTGDLEAAAELKLEEKQVDMLVANDVARPGIGFDSDENAVLILTRDGRRRDVARAAKRLIAEAVLDEVVVTLG